jgi:hypothetical protein
VEHPLRGDLAMSRRPRLGLGLLAFGAYVIGLALAGMSTFLAVTIGPVDGFAVGMIVVPGVIGLAGGGRGRPPRRSRRRLLALVALVVGGAWVAATVWVVALFASIGR